VTVGDYVWKQFEVVFPGWYESEDIARAALYIHLDDTQRQLSLEAISNDLDKVILTIHGMTEDKRTTLLNLFSVIDSFKYGCDKFEQPYISRWIRSDTPLRQASKLYHQMDFLGSVIHVQTFQDGTIEDAVDVVVIDETSYDEMLLIDDDDDELVMRSVTNVQKDGDMILSDHEDVEVTPIFEKPRLNNLVVTKNGEQGYLGIAGDKYSAPIEHSSVYEMCLDAVMFNVCGSDFSILTKLAQVSRSLHNKALEYKIKIPNLSSGHRTLTSDFGEKKLFTTSPIHYDATFLGIPALNIPPAISKSHNVSFQDRYAMLQGMMTGKNPNVRRLEIKDPLLRAMYYSNASASIHQHVLPNGTATKYAHNLLDFAVVKKVVATLVKNQKFVRPDGTKCVRPCVKVPAGLEFNNKNYDRFISFIKKKIRTSGVKERIKKTFPMKYLRPIYGFKLTIKAKTHLPVRHHYDEESKRTTAYYRFPNILALCSSVTTPNCLRQEEEFVDALYRVSTRGELRIRPQYKACIGYVAGDEDYNYCDAVKYTIFHAKAPKDRSPFVNLELFP